MLVREIIQNSDILFDMNYKEILRGEIWWVDLGESIGSEQRGIRPCVVLSNNDSNKGGIITILPLTRQIKNQPTHVVIKSLSQSQVLAEQIRSVDIKRLTNYTGRVSEKELEEIEKAAMIQLGIIH